MAVHAPLNLSASDDIICSVGRLEERTVIIVRSRSNDTLHTPCVFHLYNARAAAG